MNGGGKRANRKKNETAEREELECCDGNQGTALFRASFEKFRDQV